MAGIKRSIFDSDSDEDSNDGRSTTSTATASKIIPTATASVGGSSANADEDLSPTKKIKLVDKIDDSTQSTAEKDDSENSENNQAKILLTESTTIPVRNTRRSTRTQQIDKANDKIDVKKNKQSTASNNRGSKVTNKASDDDDKCNQSQTKGKCKRVGRKKTSANSNLVPESNSTKVLKSTTPTHDNLSDSDDSICEVVAKSTKSSNNRNTKSTTAAVKPIIKEDPKIIKRALSNLSSSASSSSLVNISKNNNSTPATSTGSSIKSPECTPTHNAKTPAPSGTNSTVAGGLTKIGTNSIVTGGLTKIGTNSIMTGGSTKTPVEESSKAATPGSSSDVCEEAPIVLTAAQRARIEQNRQKALLIRQERMNKMLPPLKKSEQLEKEGKKVLRINDTKLVDTGAGFFLDEDDGFEHIPEADIIAALRRAEEPAPLIPEDRPHCLDCGNTFDSSYLVKNFDHSVCDDCRDNESRHALITKTDARNEYLLQDVDLEKRTPALRFIVRKNPHNDRWGDMKLYLKLQIEKRCLEVWGSEEALEEAIAKKAEQREVSKQKKFKKKMLELRMNVRSSLYTRASKSHEHEYGEEEYHEEDDEYSKTCATCGHSYRFDKM